MVPTLKEEDGWLFETEAMAQLSVVTGVPKLLMVAEQSPAPTLTEMFAGQMMVGSSVSVTVTV